MARHRYHRDMGRGPGRYRLALFVMLSVSFMSSALSAVPVAGDEAPSEPTDWVALGPSSGASIGQIGLVHLDGTERVELQGPDYRATVVPTPDGNHLAVSSWSGDCRSDRDICQSGFRLTNLDGSCRSDPLRPLAAEKDDNVTPAAWSPDGTRLLFVSASPAQGHTRALAHGTGVFDLEKGARWVVPPRARPGAGPWPLGWSADGAALLFRQNAGVLFSLPPGGGPRRTILDGLVNAAQWSPDGQYAAAWVQEQNEQQLWVVRRDGSGEHAVFTERGGQPFGPAWSPDGSQLAFGRRNGSIDDGTDLWIVGADGTGLRRVTTGAMADRTFWSPDGRQLVFGRWVEPFSTWTVATDGTELREIGKGHPVAVWRQYPQAARSGDWAGPSWRCESRR